MKKDPRQAPQEGTPEILAGRYEISRTGQDELAAAVKEEGGSERKLTQKRYKVYAVPHMTTVIGLAKKPSDA